MSEQKVKEVDKATVEILKKAIGQQLAAERNLRSLSQEDIAGGLGVTQRTVSMIERGENPVINHFLGYALILGVDFHLIIARAYLMADALLKGESSPV